MRPRTLRNLLLLLVFGLAALLLAAACDDEEEEPAPEPTATAGEVPEETPEAIDISGVEELADGTLTIGSDIAYAPMEFYQEGTEIADGLDVDLAKAIAAELGVDVEFVNSGFDGLIPALNANDFDIIVSSMTITETRQQEVDFVPYLNVGTGILVPAGNPDTIQELADLCGLTVAVQLGTIQETMVRDQSAQCAEEIEVVVFDTNPLAVEDLRTGGADANLSDYPVAYLDAQVSEGALEVLTVQLDPAPYGIAVRKTSTALRAVLEEAVTAVKASGDYDQILDKWDLGSAALD